MLTYPKTRMTSAASIVSFLEIDFPWRRRVVGVGLCFWGSGGCATSGSELEGGDVDNNR